MRSNDTTSNSPVLNYIDFNGESIPFLETAEKAPEQPDSPDELVEEGQLTSRVPWVSSTFFVQTHFFDITPQSNCFEARYDTPNELRCFSWGKAGQKYLVEIEVECLQVNSYTKKATMKINSMVAHDFGLNERHTMKVIQEAPEDGLYRVRLKESTTTSGDYRARWKVYQIRVNKI